MKTKNCNHTPDNDGHCHFCGEIVNYDYHEWGTCSCLDNQPSIDPSGTSRFGFSD